MLGIILLTSAIFFMPVRTTATPVSPVDSVDPFVGTSGNGFDGATNTFPGADAPFGMIQWSPDTPAHNAGGGYYYGDSSITGFTLTHLSGPGCSVFGDIGFLPTIGGIVDPANASQPFSHASETAAPGYYSVIVGMPGIATRLAVTTRTGLGSFTFPPAMRANVLINASSDEAGVTNADIRFVGDREVTGSATSGGFCGMPGTYTVYFAARFDRPFVEHGTWLHKQMTAHSDAASGAGVGGWVTFDASVERTIKVQTSISWVSVAGAETNLRSEATSWDVDHVRRAAAAQWSAELSRVRIRGGTQTQQRIFYTALYHAMLHPNVFNDADGQYRGFDQELHRVRPGHTEYATFSGWDIYRTAIPLLALLEPERTGDMMQSLVDASHEMGWLPKWSLVNAETGVMGGDPSDPMIAAAYAFGARGFDARAALAAMLNGATQPAGPGGQGWYKQRPALDEYLARGYVTNDHTTNVSPVPNGASLTLEYSLDDFSIAQFAHALGDQTTYQMMMQRAQNWANVFDQSSGLIAPRDSSGAFLQTPLQRSGQSGFQEGTAAQYTWMVPQNLAALIEGMGGRAQAIQKLDAFFSQIDGGPSVPYAWMGNEPSIGSPWVYLAAGAPWKAQRVIRDVMTQLWGDTPDGVPGNDDLGTMSAWYVWCALGLYPQNPATAVFDLGTPLFEHASIRVPAGASIDIAAPAASTANAFVLSVRLGGKFYEKSWIAFSKNRSMKLHFLVGPKPSEQWGSEPGAEPPSYALGAVRFPESALASIAAPTPNHLDLRAGSSATVHFGVANAGPNPATISWQAAVPDALNVTPESGTVAVAPSTTSDIAIRIRAARGAPPGLYNVPISGRTQNGALIPRSTAVIRIGGAATAIPLVFVANYSSDVVTPIDATTHSYGAPISVGKSPRDLALSPDRKRLYVVNERSNDVTVIDTGTQVVIATVKAGNAPYSVASAPDGATVWVANARDDTVQPINAATLEPGPAISVGKQPEGMAFSPDGSTLFVADQGSNDVTLLDVRSRTVAKTIPVGVRPRSVAVSPDGKTVYVANQASNSVTAIDLATGNASFEVAAGFSPRRLAISPDGRRLYAADTGSDVVTPIDVASRSAGKPIVVGSNPYALALDRSGSLLFAALGGDKKCVIVDLHSGEVSASIPAGDFPLAIAQ